jgi:hypothetical protein
VAKAVVRLDQRRKVNVPVALAVRELPVHC